MAAALVRAGPAPELPALHLVRARRVSAVDHPMLTQSVALVQSVAALQSVAMSHALTARMTALPTTATTDK